MSRLRPQSHSPVGIDVGGRSISAVQLHGTQRDRRVSAAVRLPRSRPGAPLDSHEVARLRDVLARQAFTGNLVVLAVPSHQLMTAVMQLPPRDSGAPVDQIAMTELARTYNVSMQSFEMSTWDLPSPEHVNRAALLLAVGFAHEEADALFDLFRESGMRIAALDMKAWAIARAAGPIIASGTGITAMLDLEWDAAVLALFYRGVVLYDRTMNESGFKQLHAALTEVVEDDALLMDYLLDTVGLQPSTEGIAQAGLINARRRMAGHFEAIVKDVDESLRYASRQYPDAPFEKLLLVGDAASIPGLGDHLTTVLNVEVCTLATSDVVKCDASLLHACDNPTLLPAVGLAMADERKAA